MADEASDWSVYRIQVLSELKRINGNVEKLADSDTEIRITVGKLQLCSALTGAVAGILAAFISMFILYRVF